MSARKHILFLDEDPDNRFGDVAAGDKASVATLQARTESLGRTAVDIYVVCVNADRANFPCKSLESYLERPDATPEKAMPWLRQLMELTASGVDSNDVLISGTRNAGRIPWIGVRMNDAHGNDAPDSPVHSEFWRNHPELWCESLDFPCDNTLDYSHECVRCRMLDFIAEVLERYDAEGILLDWMRWPSFFPHDKGNERRGILTQFMKNVREMVARTSQKRGHRIELAVRVPVEIRHAVKLGLDAVEWARQGLVDWLFLGNFFCGLEVDVPVEDWKKQIGNPGFPVAVTVNLTFAAEPPCGEIQRVSPDDVRGVAASAWYHGADGVYPFNFMDCIGPKADRARRQAALEDAASPRKLRTLPRRHRVNWSDSELRLSELDQMNRVPGFREKWEKRCEREHYWPASLPAMLAAGEVGSWKVCTAWKPAPEKKHRVCIKVQGNANSSHLHVLVNGCPVLAAAQDAQLFCGYVPSECFSDGYATVEIHSDNGPLKVCQIFFDLNIE